MSVKQVHSTDEHLRDVASLLFGDAGTDLAEVVSKAEQSKRDERLQNLAIAGNAASTVAGPAAIYSAYRAAKTNSGGIPRDVATGLTGANKPKPTKFGRTKVGQKIARGVKTLNNPRTSRAKVGAAAAGATLVGLQGINVGTDALSTKLLSDQKKKEKVGKGYISKMSPDAADLHVPGKREMALYGAKKTAPHVKDKSEKTIKFAGGKLKHIHTQKVQKSNYDVTWEGEFSKMDEDKRQVFGWASIVKKDGQDVVDLQGDYISIDEIEKSAYDYVVKSRKGGNQHQRNGEDPLHVADMIESFIVTPEKIEKMGLPEETPLGWWVGYQINDDDTWKQVKNGERTGFSIHGRGVRSPHTEGI